MKTSENKGLPLFKRAEVATILNVTTFTIYNREKRNQYPPAQRDLNNYRVYTLEDVFNLQLLTYGHCDPKPVLRIMFDKGYTDPKVATKLVSDALNKKLAYE